LPRCPINRRSPVPFAFIVQTAYLPLRSETNAIRLPSGE
jgi:hypothetical protein